MTHDQAYVISILLRHILLPIVDKVGKLWFHSSYFSTIIIIFANIYCYKISSLNCTNSLQPTTTFWPTHDNSYKCLNYLIQRTNLADPEKIRTQPRRVQNVKNIMIMDEKMRAIITLEKLWHSTSSRVIIIVSSYDNLTHTFIEDERVCNINIWVIILIITVDNTIVLSGLNMTHKSYH